MVQLSRAFNGFGLLFVFCYIFHFSFYFRLVDSEIKIDKMSYKQKKRKNWKKEYVKNISFLDIISKKENGLIMNFEFRSFWIHLKYFNFIFHSSGPFYWIFVIICHKKCYDYIFQFEICFFFFVPFIDLIREYNHT